MDVIGGSGSGSICSSMNQPLHQGIPWPNRQTTLSNSSAFIPRKETEKNQIKSKNLKCGTGRMKIVKILQ